MVQNVEPQEAFFVPVENGVNTLPWRYLAASEHQAALLDGLDQVTRDLVYGVDFSVAPEGDTLADVGEIKLLTAPTSSETQLRVRGRAAASQAVPPEPGTAAIVASLDRMAIVLQQVQQGIDRVDVPAEIEKSQAAAVMASVFADAAEESAEAAALFDPSGYQPLNALLTALAALAGASEADRLAFVDGAGSMALTALTLEARNLIAASTKADMRAVLELGSAALLATQSTVASSVVQIPTGEAVAELMQMLVVRDEKSSGADGGSANADWNTRQLNTIKVNNIPGAGLASNTITLPVGTFFISAVSAAYRVGRTQLRIKNVTDNLTDIVGPPLRASNTYEGSVSPTLSGMLQVSGGSKSYQLEMYCQTGVATNGLGFGAVSGETSVLSEVIIQRTIA